MTTVNANRTENTVAMLRRMTQPPVAEERCEFCGLTIAPNHRHLLEIAKRQVICVCDPCALRFQGVIGGRFKLIPRDGRRLTGFQMTEGQWDELGLPIELTFFYRDSAAGKVTSMYPSPAGAVESLLPTKNWETLEAQNPVIAQMEADVEALLVNRTGGAREYFIIPMDLCYELVGIIRMHWRGLAGGDKVWQEVESFFARLRENAQSGEAAHA